MTTERSALFLTGATGLVGGLVLFGVYLAMYVAFVLINAFRPDWMDVTPLGGVNLAIWYGFGLIGNIVVGVVGAFIGNWLFPQLGLWGADMVGMIISAVLGAIILLVVIGLIRRVA